MTHQWVGRLVPKVLLSVVAVLLPLGLMVSAIPAASGATARAPASSVGHPPCSPVTGAVVFIGDNSAGEAFIGSTVQATELEGDFFWVEAAHRPFALSNPSASSTVLSPVCSFDSGGAYSTLFEALSAGTVSVTSSGVGTGTLGGQITVVSLGAWGQRIETVGASGAVYGEFFNSAPVHLVAPMVGIESTPDGGGYWTAAADGGVFSYQDAGFYGSGATWHLAAPIVGMAADPLTGGYWLVGRDGGVFSFHAPFLGSASGFHLAAPIVAMASTPDGKGYWLVGADGGVFSFGDARFYGSMAPVHLAAPVVGIASTGDGGGYWLDGSDGGVFSFGDAPFHGSGPTSNPPVAGPLLATPDNGGYWLATQGAGCSSYGNSFACVTSCPANGCNAAYSTWVGATALQTTEPLIEVYQSDPAHIAR